MLTSETRLVLIQMPQSTFDLVSHFQPLEKGKARCLRHAGFDQPLTYLLNLTNLVISSYLNHLQFGVINFLEFRQVRIDLTFLH